MAKLIVPVGSPQRVDAFLAQHMPGWSRRVAQRALEAGAVILSRESGGASRRVRKGDLVQTGDVLDIDAPWVTPRDLQPNPTLALPIRFEDDDLIVVDKPAGLASAALQATDTQTVASFLVGRWPGIAAVGTSPLDGGLVHRLDTNTSGLLLAAKTAAAHQDLRRQFAEHSVEKEYLAIVHGEVRTAGWITTAIGHERRRRDRMRVVADGAEGRPASTSYKPVAVGDATRVDDSAGPRSLLRVQIATGVMHQIRVHVASISHPVIGDVLYGSPILLPGRRHLLHASRLAFLHPRTGKRVEMESPPPDDFTGWMPSEVRHRPRT